MKRPSRANPTSLLKPSALSSTRTPTHVRPRKAYMCKISQNSCFVPPWTEAYQHTLKHRQKRHTCTHTTLMHTSMRKHRCTHENTHLSWSVIPRAGFYQLLTYRSRPSSFFLHLNAVGGQRHKSGLGRAGLMEFFWPVGTQEHFYWSSEVLPW